MSSSHVVEPISLVAEEDLSELSESEDDSETANMRSTARKSMAAFDRPVPTPSGSRRTAARGEVPADHYIVKKVVGHRYVRARREFILRFDDGSEYWTKESECRYCIKRVMHHCNKNGLPRTKLPPPPGGSAGITEVAEDNWVTAEQVVQKVAVHGRSDALQPYVFEKRHDWDSLYLDQVGEHFFAVLYLHDRQIALVADGLNSLPQDTDALEIVKEDFAPAEVKIVNFMGQNRDDRCGAAAAAILIEFQKAYGRREIPTVIHPEKSTYSRIERALHKIVKPKITGWNPIHKQRIGITCPKCRQNFRRSRSRAALNLHVCPTENP